MRIVRMCIAGKRGRLLKNTGSAVGPSGEQLKRITDSTARDQYGDPLRIGTMLMVAPVQAKVVEEIFRRWSEGESCGAIARYLNARGEPSPGSTWRRRVRRCRGWMDSSLRVILLNPLYTGRQRWNASQFVVDPGTNKTLRRARPAYEHVVNYIQELRIVSDALFSAAQARFTQRSNPDPALKRAGRAI